MKLLSKALVFWENLLNGTQERYTLGRVTLYLLAFCIQLFNGLPYLKVEPDARERVRAKISKELRLGRAMGKIQNYIHLFPILL